MITEREFNALCPDGEQIRDGNGEFWTVEQNVRNDKGEVNGERLVTLQFLGVGNPRVFSYFDDQIRDEDGYADEALNDVNACVSYLD